MSDEEKFSQNDPVAPSLRSAGSLHELGRGTAIALTVSAAEEMRELGRRLASMLTAGDLVILSGGLGAGKTTLTQGIGDGLRVRGPITSPTFVIARVHPPLAASAGGASAGGASAGGGGASAGGGQDAAERGPALVHADAYRLGSVLELDDLDLDADTASSVTVVEWGEGLAEGLSADRLEITIAPVVAARDAAWDAEGAAADRPRTVRISAVGERWEGVELPLLGFADRL
jgi:tRNA threonylcarbamoyladenosine biosynthesis protein TsaE